MKYLVLGGLNDYEVLATTWNSFDTQPKKCDWLGHHVFRCGKCRKGYFRVRSVEDHDEKCPSCEAHISLRRLFEAKEEG